MIKGYYTSASGIIAQQKRLNAYANNLANVSTAGYKKDALIQGTFGEHLAIRMNGYNASGHHELGDSVYMTAIDSDYTDYNQGTLDATKRPLDIAILGEGFFVVAEEEGPDMYTRNGAFALDEEGFLILPGYGRVQSEYGDIQIGTTAFSVDRNGNIYIDPEEFDDPPVFVDQLLIMIPENYATMTKLSNSMYAMNGPMERLEDNAGTVIMQNTLERANVDMAEEMTRILASQRSLQSASQLVRMYDELSQKANDSIGRVR